MSKKCEHNNVETIGYPHEYYGRWAVIEVTVCLDCGEILEEKETRL